MRRKTLEIVIAKAMRLCHLAESVRTPVQLASIANNKALDGICPLVICNNILTFWLAVRSDSSSRIHPCKMF